MFKLGEHLWTQPSLIKCLNFVHNRIFFLTNIMWLQIKIYVSSVVCKMANIRYGIKMEYEINRKEIKTFFVQFQCKREIPILREPNWENYIFIFRYIYAMHADA